MLTILGIIELLLLTPNAFATKQVIEYTTHAPVSVCTPSDTNSNCTKLATGPTILTPNVGIGTATPTALLHVGFNNSSTNALKIDTNNLNGTGSAIVSNSGGNIDNFGVGAASGNQQAWARFFNLGTSYTITSATLNLIANVGSPTGTMTCSINNYTAGSPTLINAAAGLTAAITPTASATNTFTFTPSVIAAGNYALVCVQTVPGSGLNKWVVNNITGANGYTSNNNGSTWSTTNEDGQFSVIGYTAGTNLRKVIVDSNGNTGIGVTAQPINTLDVAGGVSIGTSFATTLTAPTDGLAVLGNVGIGTSIAQQGVTVYDGHLRFNTFPAPQTACTAALAGLGAGNVDNEDHVYYVTFVTGQGETQFSPASNTLTVVNNTINGQVALTGIPKGPAGTTARKIYRTKPPAGNYYSYYLTTLNDNTTTTYTDNAADSSLTIPNSGIPAGFVNNTTAGKIFVNNTLTEYVGTSSTNLGLRANSQFNGDVNATAIGTDALANNVTSNNTAVGVSASQYLNAGIFNTSVGVNSLRLSTGGGFVTALGMSSCGNNTNPTNSTCVGYGAGATLPDLSTAVTSGSNQTFLGFQASPQGQGDVNEIVIGYDAAGNGSNSTVIGNNTTQDTILWGNVGIGTIKFPNQLTVNGGVGIGTANSSYVTTYAAPSGGIAVQGNVGIGTWTPGSSLEVEGGNVGIGTWKALYPLDIKKDNVGSSQNSDTYVALDLHNTTVATNVLQQNTPVFKQSGSYWDGTQSQPMAEYTSISDNGSGSNGTYAVQMLRGTTLNTTLSIDYFGQFLSPLKYNQFNNTNTYSNGFQAGNDDPATVSGNGFSPTFHWFSTAWKTAATAGAQYMTLDEANNPQTGVISPIGIHSWFFGTNANSASSTNELMRLQWGSDAGVTGAFFNKQNLSGYTLGITGNVGIGTATPGQALDVAGTVRISGGVPLNFINCKAATGARYLCVDTSGNILCQAAACVGT